MCRATPPERNQQSAILLGTDALIAKVSKEERAQNRLNHRTAQTIFRQESRASHASTILQRMMSGERTGVPICTHSLTAAEPKRVHFSLPAPVAFYTKEERRANTQALQAAAQIRKQEQADLASIRKVAAEARKADAKRAKKRAAKARRKIKKAPLEPGRKPTLTKVDTYRIKYEAYINSPEWQLKRQEAFRFHGKFCNHCRTTRRLHVHHVTYANFTHERMEDLMILCEPCHEIEHKRLDREKLAGTAGYAQKSH